MMKLKKISEVVDYLDILTTGGIFSKIASTENQPFEWLTNTIALTLDKEYYLARSGDKYISPLYQRLLELVDGGSEIDVMQTIASIIIQHYENEWNRLFEVLIVAEYNPIENYNMYQKETPNITKQVDASQNSKIKVENVNREDTSSTYGFNSSDATPVSKVQYGGDVITSGDIKDNHQHNTESETGTRELERSGNIGVTTTQQMIESEIELRKTNFVDIIMGNVDEIQCLKSY